MIYPDLTNKIVIAYNILEIVCDAFSQECSLG